MERQVYFAQCGDRIKIGVSSNITARLAQLRQGAGGDVKLLASIEGDFEIERALHNKLRMQRIDGEWFRDCAEVRAAIQNSENNFPKPTPADIKANTASKFKAVCKVLWPEQTGYVLAEIAGVDARTAHRWLSGQSEPPAVVFSAILNELTRRE
jgi:hypothetical protein